MTYIMKLTNEDKDDLLKYARYFALKAAQIIVSSRQKTKNPTPCRPKPDWFNLNIAAIEESDANAIRREVTNKFFRGVPLCVEIYLESSEGEILIESWCIRLSSEYSDPSPKLTTFNVYNQMGVLLKSLLSVTRVIPAFKISQGQGESYVLHYRMYESEPDFGGLGEHCKHISIGRIYTPIGALQISVDYQTKIEIISTTLPIEEDSMLYNSTHFNADTNPQTKVNKNYQGDDKFVRYHIPFAGDYHPTPIKKCIPALRPGGVPWYPKGYHKQIVDEEKPNTTTNCGEGNIAGEINSTEKLHKTENSSPSNCLIIKEVGVTEPQSQELSSSGKSLSSEYMMNIISKYKSKPVRKSMCYPFANETPESEISNFYRECSNAPLLTYWKRSSSVKDIDVTEQLDAFEEKVKEFDDLVKSLSASPDNDN